MRNWGGGAAPERLRTDVCPEPTRTLCRVPAVSGSFDRGSLPQHASISPPRGYCLRLTSGHKLGNPLPGVKSEDSLDPALSSPRGHACECLWKNSQGNQHANMSAHGWVLTPGAPPEKPSPDRRAPVAGASAPTPQGARLFSVRRAELTPGRLWVRFWSGRIPRLQASPPGGGAHGIGGDRSLFLSSMFLSLPLSNQ